MLAVLILLSVVGMNASVSQAPLRNPDRLQLADNSKAVVVAVLEETSPVVRGDKEITKTRTSDTGQIFVEFQKPSDFLLGRLAKFRIESLISSDGSLKTGGVVNVFLPYAYPHENHPILIKGQTYLLFLNALKPTKEMKGAFVQATNPPSKRLPFTPRSNYVIVDDSSGALRVTPATQKEVDRVKAALQRN